MEFHDISGISSSKALTKRECGPTREHAKTHRDACSLSSVNERDTLDISMS